MGKYFVAILDKKSRTFVKKVGSLQYSHMIIFNTKSKSSTLIKINNFIHYYNKNQNLISKWS